MSVVDAERLAKFALAVEAMQREPLLAEVLPLFEQHTQAVLDLWRALKLQQQGGGSAELHLDIPPAPPPGARRRPARCRPVLRPNASGPQPVAERT